jgi:hypothetical protein
MRKPSSRLVERVVIDKIYSVPVDVDGFGSAYHKEIESAYG